MNDEFYGENENVSESAEQSSPENGTFHYNYTDNASRWEPDSQKYNTPTPQPPKKKRHLWWIPVAVIMTVIVAIVAVVAVFGYRFLKSEVANAKISSYSMAREEVTVRAEEETAASELLINDIEGVALADTNSVGVYLTDVSDVVNEVMPAVVSITSRTLISNGGYGGFFDYYFGNQGSGEEREVESGLGSGTIVGENEKELLILTSYHVVKGSSSLYVTFCDDAAVDGYIKAASEDDDIAIVAVPLDEIPEKTMSQIKIAKMTNEQPDVGDGAIVIGNALGYGQSVVTGIISALDRQIIVDNKAVTVIQTDAAINNGNSGGCLLNSKGEIIGISEAKINSSAVEGMCYAISIHYYYDKIMNMLERAPKDNEESNVETPVPQQTQSAYLGIYGYDIGDQLAESYGIPEGVYVLSTVKGGGAEEAGIKEGDVIIKMDDKSIASMTDLQNALASYKPGDKVTITYMRAKNNSYEEYRTEVTLTAAIG